MNLSTLHASVDMQFQPLPLKFGGETYRNVFARKNNKTVAQTLAHRRYAKLQDETTQRYGDEYLDQPLGAFLLMLKQRGDDFYLRFLNKYGDFVYCQFQIADPHQYNIKGVYAYCVDDDLKYIGRCKDSMKKRVNQGYGKIHPKNCYLDGQATNCRLNALITETQQSATLWILPMTSATEIEAKERRLIQVLQPAWNIQH